ncbi:DUF2267 domain-containing protein [Micromonospora sp. Llam7]|uniref:DUF2267 domain-containing protein n=1 Tax=Micromonospora tarapacensis TaxID=2835305 RepID=UPI001C829E26|nr:DUF2267 domain-containing protein [Micromonospora tarapacensis]MBX7266953.1 DUF2267 domain-containing protein [Micromonospora tarapacensis]
MAELQFFEKVAGRAGVAPDTAQALTVATLRTLTERISGGEAARLADRVAYELRDYLTKGTEEPEAFGYDEFLRRVTERAGVDPELAERGVRAVLQTLHPVAGHREFTDALAQLPAQLRNLVQPLPRAP